MVRDIRRRDIVRGIGAASIVGMAGCLGGGDDGDGDDDSDAGDGDTGDSDSGDSDTGDSDTGGSDLGELRVGVLAPETGDLGSLGTPISQGGALPGAQLDGETDFDIEVRREDTETQPEVGVDRAQALADAGFPSVTGAASSSVTIQVAQAVYFEEEIVGISPASTSPDITELDGTYLLRTAPTDALQGVAAAELAFNSRGLETVGVFALNNAYGQGLADAFESSFQDVGGEVLASGSFEPQQPSYASELEAVLADDPDAMYLVGYPESGEQIFRDFYENFDADRTTIIVADGMQDEGLPGSVDNPMTNVIGTAPAAVGPDRETFNQLYEDEYGLPEEADAPGVFTAEAYDATAVHLLAQARAGELSGPAVAEEIRPVANPGGEVITPSNLAEGIEMAAAGDEIQYQGASSIVEFDDNGDLAAATFNIFEFNENGYDVTDQVEL